MADKYNSKKYHSKILTKHKRDEEVVGIVGYYDG